ncbi:hypothetical protein K437DRAFT_258686 [Tilletiaria anomala UBC 951]|uniref:Alpha/beta-hydrolase n=1 Tax=Tilletiaria anomala (strain ATCC 24038 / CBS 436.72 / UBC 951) TaxID=1037660 RepID=A0A066VFY8_TILAU|nr:uncharacterized protein K437DRAFT_258686 [Tilletiaria anomala UBC 951]KDN40346.1 hypothetical protein K437DRAFT_258686 [Tilletiaria anomala UBC 951]
MTRLIPVDALMLATRALIFGLWSITPICWLYIIAFFLHELGYYPSSILPEGVLRFDFDRNVTSKGLLAYCLIENAFSIYLHILKRRIQKPGPRPIYGRRFLCYVFSRALEGGLGSKPYGSFNPTANGDSAANRPNRGASVYNLRKRLAPTTLEPITVIEQPALKPRSPGTISPSLGQTEDEKAKTARIARLRSVSYVPSFVDGDLHRDDPRAKTFMDEYRRWFWNVPIDDLTQRDVEHWLAWSLYGTTLEEIEAESKAPTSKQNDDTGIRVRSFSSPAPPQWSEPGGRRPILRSVPSSASTLSEEGVRSVKAEPGEWDDPVRGTRLDFLHYCRELIEARQGFTLPEHPAACSPAHTNNGPRIRTMRLTVDPVRVVSRPFVLYAVTNTLSWLVIRKAIWGGFKKERRERLEYLIYRPPGWTPAKAIKDGTSKYRPLLFLHGLGIGLAQYIAVVDMFLHDTETMQRPILILIQPSISQNIFSKYFLAPLKHHETTGTLRKIFRSEGWDVQGCHIDLLGHSWGTICSAWVLKCFPGLIQRTCLVDPVCFQLWVPHVCANFVYLRADTPMKLILRYFVAREVGTANVLCRHFDWPSNILWPEEILHIDDPTQTRILLASDDAILNSEANHRYLVEHGMRDEKDGGGLFVGQGMVHGELLMHPGVGMQKVKAWIKGEYL